MIPYVNIHTHHLSKDSGVFLFNNRYGFDSKVYVDSFFSVGIHPWDSELDVSKIAFERVIQHPNCLAIGECGLDRLTSPDLAKQEEVLKFQLKLAIKYRKPVIIHCVKAYEEIIKICDPYHSKIPIMIHGFNKSYELLSQLIAKGFYISLHPFFFKKEENIIRTISLEKLFLETDNNRLISIQEIYKMTSVRLKISEEYLKNKIYNNFTTLFYKNGR